MKVFHFYCWFAVFSCTFALVFKEYRRFLEEQSRNVTFVKLFDQHVHRFQSTSKKSTDFPCEAFKSQKNASTVHELTPSDVKVIAAIGDSITAGTGITAKTPIGLLTQDRGLSWSVGGDDTIDEHITLANMLKRYNPDLVGFSVETGDYDSPNAHLNVADPGNKARDMPFQAKLLVERMKSGKEGIDFQNDWKVITMFIGGNYLCEYCKDRPEYTVEKYIDYITEALDIFHKEVPRAFVNVVETINIGHVPLLNEGLICDTLHFFTCQCGAFPGSDENKKELDDLVDAYQKGLQNLVDSGRYDTRDDFTVVDQPFFSQTQIPVNPDGSTDLKYFAPDCFHFSELGQEAAANALWDNMIEPVGQKRTFWKPGEPVECPDTEQPYFYTKKNSPPLTGIGYYRDNSEQSDGFQNTSINKSDTLSDTTVAGVIVGVICLIALVSGYVYFLQRNPHNVEKDHILKRRPLLYTQI